MRRATFLPAHRYTPGRILFHFRPEEANETELGGFGVLQDLPVGDAFPGGLEVGRQGLERSQRRLWHHHLHEEEFLFPGRGIGPERALEPIRLQMPDAFVAVVEFDPDHRADGEPIELLERRNVSGLHLGPGRGIEAFRAQKIRSAEEE